MRKLLVAFVVVAVTVAFLQLSASDKKLLPAGTHLVKTEGGMDVSLTIPSSISPEKGCSLIVLLHGAQMKDINDVKSVWNAWSDSFSKSGYIVVVPRSKTNKDAWAPQDVDDLTKFCRKIAEDYGVAGREGAAVGHSSGADGAARLVVSDPKLFSAFISLGGQSHPDVASFKNNNIGVFLFHFNGDPIVNINASKQLEATLKQAGVDVTLKSEDNNSHAIEFYAQRALQPVTSWLSAWMKDKARKLTSVGEDKNLNWIVLSDIDPREAAKNDNKPFLIYAYSQKDKENKAAQYLELDLFPNTKFKEATNEFNCYKLDLDNAKELAKKLSISSCGLYIFDSKGKQTKKIDKPTSIDKLVKDMEKLAPQPKK